MLIPYQLILLSQIWMLNFFSLILLLSSFQSISAFLHKDEKNLNILYFIKSDKIKSKLRLRALNWAIEIKKRIFVNFSQKVFEILKNVKIHQKTSKNINKQSIDAGRKKQENKKFYTFKKCYKVYSSKNKKL